jgi:hypothetical protein
MTTASTATTDGGLYIKCRLVSDNEPERRVWKLSTRTKPDRGELLYQAPFEIMKRNSSSSSSSNSSSIYDDDTSVDAIEWQTIYVPFDRFRLVRGPTVVENGPPLNVSTGIYQIGMTMSQFLFAAAAPTGTPNNNNINNNTVRIEKKLPNFRDGYFELHIEEMGVYSTKGTSQNTVAVESDVRPTLNVLSRRETKEQRSVLVKAIFVVAKLFFSEQSQRRKSTMRILQKKYNMTRLQAIRWGYQRRLVISSNDSSRHGVVMTMLRTLPRRISSMMKTLSILSIDTIRSILSLSIKLFLFYPVRLLSMTLALFKLKKQSKVMS